MNQLKTLSFHLLIRHGDYNIFQVRITRIDMQSFLVSVLNNFNDRLNLNAFSSCSVSRARILLRGKK